MTSDHEHAVRTSWAELQADPVLFSRRFYAHLFELDPRIRALFARTDMEAQQRKLFAALAELVRLLDDPSRLVSVVVPLGRRHAGYGVTDRDYETLSAAFLATLEELLAHRYTEDVGQGWRELHRLVAAVMQRAAHAPV